MSSSKTRTGADSSCSLVDFPRYQAEWRPDDPHANFKATVASYSAIDPAPTLEALSELTGIPALCLVRYVLSRWASSGAEAVIAMGPLLLEQLHEYVCAAEESGTDEARLTAYESLRDVIRWLVSTPDV